MANCNLVVKDKNKSLVILMMRSTERVNEVQLELYPNMSPYFIEFALKFISLTSPCFNMFI